MAHHQCGTHRSRLTLSLYLSLSLSSTRTHCQSAGVCVFLLTSNCESLITAWFAVAVVQINLEIFQLVDRVFIQPLSKRCTANQFVVVAADRSRHMETCLLFTKLHSPTVATHDSNSFSDY